MFEKIRKYFIGDDAMKVDKGLKCNFAFASGYEEPEARFCPISEVAKNPVANRCIDLLARTVGSIPLSVAGGKTGEAVRNLFDAPNSEENLNRFMQKIVTRLMIDGSVYVLLLRTENSRDCMYVIPKKNIAIIKDESGCKIGYTYRTRGGSKRVMLDAFGRCDLFEIDYCSPFGFSPCELVSRSAKLYNSMITKNQAIMDNSSAFSGFFVLKESKDRNLTKNDLENIRQQIDKKIGERNAGYSPILPPGIEWEQLKYEGYDSTDTQSYVAMEIMQTFGVPSVMLENGRRSAAFSVNYKEARLNFWEDTILPLAKNITSAFEYFFRNRFLDDTISIQPHLSDIPIFNDKNIDKMLALDKVGFLSIKEKRDLSGLIEVINTDDCSFNKGKNDIGLDNHSIDSLNTVRMVK